MSSDKEARVNKAKEEAALRQAKALRSLALCLSRSDVMRIHHDTLVKELAETGAEFSDVKKARFNAYICFWFAGLAAVVERYQELSQKGTIPNSQKLSALLTEEFIDILKPFRNAVAHCSDYDDGRVFTLFDNARTVPDYAEVVAHTFQDYLQEHGGFYG